MQKEINILTGQSNFDVCLQATGGFDGFIKFLSENEIENSSITKNSEYSFDTNDTKNSSFIGYPYSTKNPTTCQLITGLVSDSITGTSLSFSWDSAIGVFGYEWFITTTNIQPTGSGTIEFTNSVTVSELDGTTTYYFWIRTVCSIGFVSGFSNLSETTLAAPAIPPVTSGLISMYDASYGVDLTGADVDKWNDLSGNGNDLEFFSGSNKALIDSVKFNPYKSIHFNATPCYKTTSDLIGTSGGNKITTWIVHVAASNPSGSRIMEFSTAGFASENDGFALTTQALPSGEFIGELKGDIGLNGSSVSISLGAKLIDETRFDKGATSTNEIKNLRYSSGGILIIAGSTGSDNTNNFGTHPLFFGASAPSGFASFEGYVTFVLIYNRLLTAPETSATESWLRTRFNII